MLGTGASVQAQYKSLFWEVSGNDLKKPSYLYGTMHISGKVAFQLGDPFYDAMQSVDVVALELEPEAWLDALFHDPQVLEWMHGQTYVEDDYDEYASDSPLPALEGYWSLGGGLSSIERIREALLFEPDILNYLMFRYGDDNSAIDYEEDTWLDMHIYQAAKKMGLLTSGLETYEQSSYFIEKASVEESMEENAREWDEGDLDDYENLIGQLEPAYRRQDLDLIDSLNNNTTSQSFRKYVLVERNKLFVHNLDSIIRTGSSVFAAMGCAHLPGKEGVIELLRARGYDVVPLNKGSRNAKRRKEIDRRIYDRGFEAFTTPDGLISFSTAAPVYLVGSGKESTTWLSLDMANGASCSFTRLKTYESITGQSSVDLLSHIDSTLYESIAGDIISKHQIKVGRYPCLDIMNRTRRGDFGRRQIIALPDEIIILQLAAAGDKVKQGYGSTFFDKLIIHESSSETAKWESPDGAMSIDFPAKGISYESPGMFNDNPDFEVMSTDVSKGFFYAAQRHVIEMPDFLDEDSYELERFMRAFCKDRLLEVVSFQLSLHRGLPSATAVLKVSEESGNTINDEVHALFVINGLSYVALSTNDTSEQSRRNWFDSFQLSRPVCGTLLLYQDKEIPFSVKLPFEPAEARSGWNTMSDLAELEIVPDLPFGTSASMVLGPPGAAESVLIDFQRYHEFSDGEDKQTFLREKRESVLGLDMQIMSEKVSWNETGAIIDFTIGDTATSRRFIHRMLLHNKSFYQLTACYDSVQGVSDFLRHAFESFQSTDTLFPHPHFELRDKAYFDALTSTDSLLRNRAVQITSEMDFSVESAQTIRKIWKELSNFNSEDAVLVRSKLLTGLSADTSSENIQFLAREFNAFPDSSEYQYEVLLALLRMKTAKAWQTYARLVVEEPPIVFDEMGGSGCELLFDSVRLAAPLLPQLMQLLAIEEYELSIYHLMAMAADSGWLPVATYRYLVPQLLVEARNEWKRIRSSKESGLAFNTDALLDYCTLLEPLRKERDIATFFDKAYTSRNGKILMDLVRFDWEHKRQPTDSVLMRLSRMNDQVNDLYSLLWKNNAVSRMPEPFSSRTKLSEIYLTKRYMQDNQTIDSVQLVHHHEAEIRGAKLEVHFYKVFKPSSGQWLGHVIAFDAREPANAWPLFIESERSVVIDDEEDAQQELEAEYLFLEESNREFVNFGTGLTDFSVHWY
jgi:uncharacterized protein YbaP (TraB family)